MNGRLLCSKPLELLRERWLPIMGILRLPLPHHVNNLNPTQDCTSAVRGLKAEHRVNPSFDRTMILLNAIVEELTLPDPNWNERTS